MARCPTPTKRRYAEAASYRAAISLSKKVGYGIRSYHCECGAYHLTRWQFPDIKANLEALRHTPLPIDDADEERYGTD